MAHKFQQIFWSRCFKTCFLPFCSNSLSIPKPEESWLSPIQFYFSYNFLDSLCHENIIKMQGLCHEALSPIILWCWPPGMTFGLLRAAPCLGINKWQVSWWTQGLFGYIWNEQTKGLAPGGDDTGCLSEWGDSHQAVAHLKQALEAFWLCTQSFLPMETMTDIQNMYSKPNYNRQW